MQTISLVAPFSRRIPDPVFKDHGMSRYILFCRANQVPGGISLAPNPRGQNRDKLVYKDVTKSLIGDGVSTGTFHLKNRGITILASSVREDPDDKTMFELSLADGDGIVDGGHTYSIIDANRAETPDDQFVKIEVLTNVPDEYALEIAEGLNTSVQVQRMSLANLGDRFAPLKTRLAAEPYVSKIAWRENDPAPFDARDLVAIMTLFNTDLYPNAGSDYPIGAYTQKAVTLERFLADDASYMKVLPILPDILTLYDTISFTARKYHNEAGGKAAALSFMEEKKKGFDFVFLGQNGQFRLSLGALYPMVGAFRYMVEDDPATGNYRWRNDVGPDGVTNVWTSIAGEMMRATRSTSDEVGRNQTAIGKSRNHWANLHNMVARRVLEGLPK